MYNFIINPDDKFFPNANEWMWNYCIFLGKFTDSRDRNYDLGIHIDIIPTSYSPGGIFQDVCDATVHSNEPGDYTSGELREAHMKNETREWKLEVYRRAKLLNIIK